jgi:hypothetical protein
MDNFFISLLKDHKSFPNNRLNLQAESEISTLLVLLLVDPVFVFVVKEN